MALVLLTFDGSSWPKNADQGLLSAVRKAGSDALRTLRTQSKRGVRDRKKVKAKYLADKAFPLTYARGKDLTWTMRVSGQGIPLSEYPNTRQTRKGVAFQVNVAGGRRLLKSAFKIGQRVFLRRGKESFPIKHILTTRVSDVFEDNEFTPRLVRRSMDAFNTTFKRLLWHELNRQG